MNLVYAPSFFPIPGSGDTERDNGLTAIAAATYAVTETIFLGAEIRHETLLQNAAPTAHAPFLGPTLFYRFSPVLTGKVA